MLIFDPETAFHKVIISKRKNFVFLLASLSGVLLNFEIFRLIHIGERYDNLIFIILNILYLGPIIGISFNFVLSIFLKIFLYLYKYSEISLRSCLAVVSYSMFPMAFSVFILLPSILAVFGIYYFTETPSPKNLKPFEFFAFNAIIFAIISYSFLLLFLGLKYITENFFKGFVFAILTSISAFILLNFLLKIIKYLLLGA